MADPVQRVVRYRVDFGALTQQQAELLERHAGTSRAVWNWGLAARNAYEDEVTARVGEAAAKVADLRGCLVEDVLGDGEWRREAYSRARKAHPPTGLTAAALGRRFTELSQDPESRFGWWGSEAHGVNRHAMSEPLRNLSKALERFYKRPSGGWRKDGRPQGWPRMKAKGRATDAFTIFNLVGKGQDPWRVIEGGHWIRVPNLEWLRVHANTQRLRRLIKRGGRPTSAQFTRKGGHWYLTVGVKFPPAPVGMVYSPTGALRPARPTGTQVRGGLVGVDLGVKVLATMSDGSAVKNPALGRAAARKLAQLQRKAARQQGRSRGVSPSKGWLATQRRIARLQHNVAARRSGLLHEITKGLVTGHSVVAIEDLNVVGMTASPAAVEDPENPGVYLANGRAAKSGLNKAILDVGFGEFRRQLEYKGPWYGSTIVEVARFAPTSKACSACGTVKPKLALAERVYECEVCGLVLDRDHNAARNIAGLGQQVLSDTSPADAGDTKRRDDVSRVGALARDSVSQDLGPPRSVAPVTDAASAQTHWNTA